jgi:hypothetical protein
MFDLELTLSFSVKLVTRFFIGILVISSCPFIDTKTYIDYPLIENQTKLKSNKIFKKILFKISGLFLKIYNTYIYIYI